MKKILAVLTLMTSMTALAEKLPKGVVYSREGGQSEYPAAFKALEEISLKGRSLPGPNEKIDKKCLIAKDKKLYFAKDDHVVTQTYISGKFQAKKAFEYSEWDGTEAPKKVMIKKGEIVENISYLSEGSCQIRIRGKIKTNECFNLTGDDKNLITISELKSDSWIGLQCEGGLGWVSEQQLSKLKGLKSFLYNPYSGNEEE